MACPYSGAPRKETSGSFSSLDEKNGGLEIPVTVWKPIADPVLLREMAKEPVFLMGGQYAILIQFAHPGLAQGSIEHSDFASRILHRLKTTARFLSAAVYGTEEEKKAIFGVIHRKHATVKSEDYFADDPELHKWTAATLFMSLIVVHRAIWGAVPRAKEEQLFRESAVYATSLRMPPDMWPKTLDDFYVYWNDGLANLPITHWAKELAGYLMYPRVPLWLKPMTPMTRMVTSHWLPERLRVAYGLTDHKKTYKFTITVIKYSYRATPRVVRCFPHGFYLRDMQRSAKRIQQTGTWIKAKK
jgi:uncharacterized protein (DUF2236 family)